MNQWKQSFDALNQEFETTKKKKEALENLLDSGRISQTTVDSFEKKLEGAFADIQKRKKALLEKMNSKAGELDEHIKTLETILANFEIRHVTGEVEEDVYQREVELLSTGLDVTKQELGTVKDAVNQISESIPIQTPQVVAEETETDVELPPEKLEEAPQVEEAEQTPEEMVEQNLPEPPETKVTEETEAPQNIDNPREENAEEETGGMKEAAEEMA
ncbi:MAG: CdvA-like protein, partial [Thermoproteota archaeon]